MSHSPEPEQERKRQKIGSPTHHNVLRVESSCESTQDTIVPRTHAPGLGANPQIFDFSFAAILSYSESRMREVISNFKRLPKNSKLETVCLFFQQCTAELAKLIEKSQVDMYSHAQAPLSDQCPLYSCTQINTVGSYGRITLLASCESEQQYVFSIKLCKLVTSIISRISIIFQSLPEVRELVYLDETSDQVSSQYPGTDFNGIEFYTKPKHDKITLYNDSGDLYDICPLFESCSTKESDKYRDVAHKLINQIVIIISHPQMNIDIVIPCLDILSDLNLHNHGRGTEWLKNLLRNDRLNVIHGLGDKAANAIMRFYSSVPLSPYFTPLFSNLVERFTSIIQVRQKPNRTLLKLEFKLLAILANSAYAPFISDLIRYTSTCHSFRDESTVATVPQELLLQLKIILSYFNRGRPPSLRKLRKDAFSKICQEQISFSESVRAAFEILQLNNSQYSFHFSDIVT